MQATSFLSASATATTALTAPNVVCSTKNGPLLTAQTITVHAFPAPTGSTTYTVGFVPIGGISVTPPSAVVLSSSTNAAGLVFSINSLAGCGGTTAGANSITLQLTAAVNAGSAVNDNTVAVTDTVTAGAGNSALTAAPVTITCAYNSTGPVYVPGSPKLVSVTSAANLGTPFTVTNSSLPSLADPRPVGSCRNRHHQRREFHRSGCHGMRRIRRHHPDLQPSPGERTGARRQHRDYSGLLDDQPADCHACSQCPHQFDVVHQVVRCCRVANVNVTSTIANAFFTVNTATLPIWAYRGHHGGRCTERRQGGPLHYHERGRHTGARHIYGHDFLPCLRHRRLSCAHQPARDQQTSEAPDHFRQSDGGHLHSGRLGSHHSHNGRIQRLADTVHDDLRRRARASVDGQRTADRNRV